MNLFFNKVYTYCIVYIHTKTFNGHIALCETVFCWSSCGYKFSKPNKKKITNLVLKTCSNIFKGDYQVYVLRHVDNYETRFANSDSG